MIHIANNIVTIMVGGTKLVQEIHPATGRIFTSEAQCFAWVVEYGWFDRCKAEAIRLLKKQTTRQIEQQVPLFKQINAALGIYSLAKRRQIKKRIQSLIQELNRKEQSLLNAKSLAEFSDLLTSSSLLHCPPAMKKNRKKIL